MDMLVDVPEDSHSPTVEWSERLYEQIMEAAEELNCGFLHDRELSIIGQGLDDEILVACPAPRGACAEPALRKIGFDPEPIETDSSLQLFKIESRMELSDVKRIDNASDQ